MTQTQGHLDYAQATGRINARRWARRLAWTALAAILAGVLVQLLPHAFTVARQKSLQQQLSAYVAPPGTVVVDLTAGLATTRSTDIAGAARDWSRYCESMAAKTSPQLVFVHARKTPLGENRIIGVHIAQLPGSSAGALVVRSIVPAQGLRRAATLSDTFFELDSKTTRIFAAQPDPTDPTHFSIDYELAGAERRTLDGWIGETETIIEPRTELQPRRK